MDKRFNKAKITIPQLQYWVLAIAQQKPITVNEIAREFGIKPPSLTPVVEALSKAGYLERKNDATDRRKIQLHISKKGRQMIKKLPVDGKKDAMNAAFGKLTPAKQKQLLDLLQELISNFSYND